MIFFNYNSGASLLLEKMSSSTGKDILWIGLCHNYTLVCNGYDPKGIKEAQCKQSCKKYDVMTNAYVWIQPTNIADPLDLHVFFIMF